MQLVSTEVPRGLAKRLVQTDKSSLELMEDLAQSLRLAVLSERMREIWLKESAGYACGSL